jgi:hypothetical protein
MGFRNTGGPAKIIQDRDRSENIATQLAYIASAALHC